MDRNPADDALISRLANLWGATSDMIEAYENSPPEVRAMLMSISKAYERLYHKYGAKGLLIECSVCHELVEDETGEIKEKALLGVRRNGEAVAYCESCAAGLDYCGGCGSVMPKYEMSERDGYYYCHDCW